MILRNDFYRFDEKIAATVTTTGGWFDLSERRLVKPPKPLLEALLTLSKTEGFLELPSSVR